MGSSILKIRPCLQFNQLCSDDARHDNAWHGHLALAQLIQTPVGFVALSYTVEEILMRSNLKAK